MKPISVVMRRPVILLILVAALAIGVLLALSKMGANGSYLNLKEFVGDKFGSPSSKVKGETQAEQQIVVTTPKIEDVTVTESFVCQIRSLRHIEVRALEGGYLDQISINEGQSVKKGDVMFKILPVLYKAKLDAENAKADVAQQKYTYTQQLAKDKVVSENEVSLKKAEMDEAQAQANFAAAELNFADVESTFRWYRRPPSKQ